MAEKEAKFMESIRSYIADHGVEDFYRPMTPKLPKTTRADVEQFEEDVRKSVSKHRALYNKFKHIEHVDWLIHRYDTLGFLNNISLSVLPSIKEEWGITHELFGAFYNTDYPYCSLFSDLEPNSIGNALTFKPKKSMVVLVNPPYTAEWIEWTCKSVIKWKGKAIFYVVLPVWDRKTRDELGLKKYEDLPEIQDLIQSSMHAEVVKLPFFDGVHNKKVQLKDPVHVIVV